MRTRLPVVLAAALLVTMLGLSGCGQKGPLVPPKALAVATGPSPVCQS